MADWANDGLNFLEQAVLARKQRDPLTYSSLNVEESDFDSLTDSQVESVLIALDAFARTVRSVAIQRQIADMRAANRETV